MEKRCLECGWFKTRIVCDHEIYSNKDFQETTAEGFDKRDLAGRVLAKDCLSFYQPTIMD